MTTAVTERKLRPLALAVLGTVATGLAVNLVIWLIGSAAGASYEMTDNGVTASVAPGGVIIMSVVPATIGLTLAAALSLRWAWIIRVAQVVGPTLAIVTVAGTIATDFDTASTIALSTMHVALAVVLYAGLERMRR